MDMSENMNLVLGAVAGYLLKKTSEGDQLASGLHQMLAVVMSEVSAVETPNSKASTLTQLDALLAQAAAVSRFQKSGELEHATEAERLSKISRVEIGPHGELITLMDATWLTNVCTENTGGGCMVDFIFMDDGRVLSLNDKAIGVYASKEAFYDQEKCTAQHFMWISDSGTLVAMSKDELVAAIKAEVTNLMADGIVPRTVKSYSELHDYCDANCLGGLCKDDVCDPLILKYGGRDTDEGMPQGLLDLISAAQKEIGNWLAEMSTEFNQAGSPALEKQGDN